MSGQDMDRNLPATPYKLEKAREKGQVAKSPDVVSAVVFAVAVVFLIWQGWTLCQAQFRLDRTLISQAVDLNLNPVSALALMEQLLLSTLHLVGPFFLALIIAGILANLLQTGPVLSFHPIKPDWDRLNPASGFKRVFSMQTLFVAARSLLKLILLGLVAWFALKALVPQFFHLADLPPAEMMQTLLADLGALGLKLALMLGLIALVDLMYTRRAFNKKMRMSHRDMREELKHREGDPRIRSRQRTLRREMLKRLQSLKRTQEADVLITNPTHVAVALRYAHGQMASPQLVAKGKGHLAAIMRQLAARHRIPVVQNPSLARALYKQLPIDHHVPPELFGQVAKIIIWVLARKEALAGKSRGVGKGNQSTPAKRKKHGKRQTWTS